MLSVSRRAAMTPAPRELKDGPGPERLNAAAHSLAEGGLIVLIGGASGSNEGCLVGAASHAATAQIAFMVRHSSGFVQVLMTSERAATLDLPPMTATWRHNDRPTFGVSVDAANGVKTGISAQDRALTIQLLGNPHSRASDFHRPGHVIPVSIPMCEPQRPSLELSALRLVAAAGCNPVAEVASIVSPADPTRMAEHSELIDFAKVHGLVAVTTHEVDLWTTPLCAS